MPLIASFDGMLSRGSVTQLCMYGALFDAPRCVLRHLLRDVLLGLALVAGMKGLISANKTCMKGKSWL